MIDRVALAALLAVPASEASDCLPSRRPAFVVMGESVVASCCDAADKRACCAPAAPAGGCGCR